MKNITLIEYVIMAGIIFILIMALSQACCTTPVQASAPGVWVCLAVTEKTLEPDYDCEAKGYSRSKRIAKEKALEKCEDKCYAECKVEACIRRR